MDAVKLINILARNLYENGGRNYEVVMRIFPDKPEDEEDNEDHNIVEHEVVHWNGNKTLLLLNFDKDDYSDQGGD